LKLALLTPPLEVPDSMTNVEYEYQYENDGIVRRWFIKKLNPFKHLIHDFLCR